MKTKYAGLFYCPECKGVREHFWAIPVGGRGALLYCNVCQYANHETTDLRRDQKIMLTIRGQERGIVDREAVPA